MVTVCMDLFRQKGQMRKCRSDGFLKQHAQRAPAVLLQFLLVGLAVDAGTLALAL